MEVGTGIAVAGIWLAIGAMSFSIGEAITGVTAAAVIATFCVVFFS